MLTNKQISYLPYDDYAQSANTLFHFMTKPEYLESILRRKAIIPRYCVETIDYLNIYNGTHSFNEAAILQKCFCDIPFHKLADSFAVNGVGDVYESLSMDERVALEKNNTHFAYYGEYAVVTTTVGHQGVKFPLEEYTNVTQLFVGPAVESVPITLNVGGVEKTITLLRSRTKDKVILRSEPDSIVFFMYISFSAFETVEEAKHEENTILQHDEIYVNALTSNAYINQYYEE